MGPRQCAVGICPLVVLSEIAENITIRDTVLPTSHLQGGVVHVRVCLSWCGASLSHPRKRKQETSRRQLRSQLTVLPSATGAFRVEIYLHRQLGVFHG